MPLAYICGEEAALIESLEGAREAAVKAAFSGKYWFVRVPNNGDERGDRRSSADDFEKRKRLVRGFGRKNNSGTKLFCISGHVNNPCTVEEEMSIPLKELIEKHCGGVRGGWDNLLAIIPGGSSVPLIQKAFARRY